jgi:hypothetical protein
MTNPSPRWVDDLDVPVEVTKEGDPKDAPNTATEEDE